MRGLVFEPSGLVRSRQGNTDKFRVWQGELSRGERGEGRGGGGQEKEEMRGEQVRKREAA